MNENQLLDSLSTLFASNDPSVLVGSGPDDCAHVRTDDARLAFSADAFAENSHFLPDTPPDLVARKALGASLSDLAASGCRARWALVSLCLRKGAANDWAGTFAHGMAAAARDFGVSIIGGDVVSGPATFVSVTVAGVPLPGGPLLRSAGKAGDALVVTGRLGGSILGRHLRPEPRLREVAALMDFAQGKGMRPGAAMDISDGLALDLSRLCRESGVGALLEASAIPVAEAAVELARRDGRSALAHALTDGEDFELLLSMPEALWEAFSRHAAGIAGLAGFTRIGVLREGGGIALRDADGERALDAEGFEHQW